MFQFSAVYRFQQSLSIDSSGPPTNLRYVDKSECVFMYEREREAKSDSQRHRDEERRTERESYKNNLLFLPFPLIFQV